MHRSCAPLIVCEALTQRPRSGPFTDRCQFGVATGEIPGKLCGITAQFWGDGCVQMPAKERDHIGAHTHHLPTHWFEYLQCYTLYEVTAFIQDCSMSNAYTLELRHAKLHLADLSSGAMYAAVPILAVISTLVWPSYS